MPAVGKKLHHKVARFYLKAWDEQGRDTEDAQVFCLQNGVIQPRNLRNIAAENPIFRSRHARTLRLPIKSLARRQGVPGLPH